MRGPYSRLILVSRTKAVTQSLRKNAENSPLGKVSAKSLDRLALQTQFVKTLSLPKDAHRCPHQSFAPVWILRDDVQKLEDGLHKRLKLRG